MGKKRENQLVVYNNPGKHVSTKSNITASTANTEDKSISWVDRERTIPALAVRAYHLPGNTWWQDYIQYFGNNHPLFGICCSHKLHPINFNQRVLNFFGSVVFGLAITNTIWLWLILSDEYDEGNAVLSITKSKGVMANSTQIASFEATAQQDDEILRVTEGMLVLWTVGGGLHALYDNTIWYMTACVCCLPGRRFECLYKYKWCGTYIVIVSIVLSAAIGTFVVVLRATISEDEEARIQDLNTGGLLDDNIQLGRVSSLSAYEFLISYGVELSLALFVHFPLIGTILFSGILGCGRVPMLGGRPYELDQERKLHAVI